MGHPNSETNAGIILWLVIVVVLSLFIQDAYGQSRTTRSVVTGTAGNKDFVLYNSWRKTKRSVDGYPDELFTSGKRSDSGDDNDFAKFSLWRKSKKDDFKFSHWRKTKKDHGDHGADGVSGRHRDQNQGRRQLSPEGVQERVDPYLTAPTRIPSTYYKRRMGSAQGGYNTWRKTKRAKFHPDPTLPTLGFTAKDPSAYTIQRPLRALDIQRPTSSLFALELFTTKPKEKNHQNWRKLARYGKRSSPNVASNPEFAVNNFGNPGSGGGMIRMLRKATDFKQWRKSG